MKKPAKVFLVFCAIFFMARWIKSDPFRIVGAAFAFLIIMLCATIYLVFSAGAINDMFYRCWLVIKKWFRFLIVSAIIFIPLILSFIFHAKKWWHWSLVGIMQIIFILLALVVFGGLVSGRPFNNSDGY